MSISKETLITVASILCALAECGGCPESMLYIHCGTDMDKWTFIRGLMTVGKNPLITIKGNWVTLAAAGKKAADEINASLTKA